MPRLLDGQTRREGDQLCPACGRLWDDHPDPSLAREWSVCTLPAEGGASRRDLLVLAVCCAVIVGFGVSLWAVLA